MKVHELIEKLQKLIEDNPNVDITELEVTLAGQEYSANDIELMMNYYYSGIPVVDIY